MGLVLLGRGDEVASIGVLFESVLLITEYMASSHATDVPVDLFLPLLRCGHFVDGVRNGGRLDERNYLTFPQRLGALVRIDVSR
jgi:hypothetical protein